MNLITRGLGKQQGLITQGIGKIISAIRRGVRSATRGGLVRKQNAITDEKKEEIKREEPSNVIVTNLIRVSRRRLVTVEAELLEIDVRAELVSFKANTTAKPIIEATYGTV